MKIFTRQREKPVLSADGSMSLLEHLYELRNRLFKAALAIVIAMIIGYLVSDPVLHFLNAPYCGRYGADKCRFTAQSPIDPFVLKLKVSLYIGIIISCPVWLYQLWAFIAPGLHRREKRWAYGFAAVGAPLFLMGAILAHFVVDKGLNFLLPANSQYDVDVNISGYFDFVTGMLLVFGVAFEFPLIIFVLNLAHIATAKRLFGWWRIAVLLIFVFTAVVTPTPDPFGMTALALPMCVLYFAACGAAAFNDHRRARAAAKHEQAQPSDDEASLL